jgi:hypothetical protein
VGELERVVELVETTPLGTSSELVVRATEVDDVVRR